MPANAAKGCPSASIPSRGAELAVERPNDRQASPMGAPEGEIPRTRMARLSPSSAPAMSAEPWVWWVVAGSAALAVRTPRTPMPAARTTPSWICLIWSIMRPSELLQVDHVSEVEDAEEVPRERRVRGKRLEAVEVPLEVRVATAPERQLHE